MADQPTGPTPEERGVLIVDSGRGGAAACEAGLDCSTTVVSDGDAARERVDGSFDVVVIDPQTAGCAELTAALAADPDGPPVAVIDSPDASEPDGDVTLTMPVTIQRLRSVVDDLEQVAAYDRQVRDRCALAERAATLETAADDYVPETETYRAVRERIATLRTESTDTLAGMDDRTATVAIEHVLR
jgi:hypothetical protein